MSLIIFYRDSLKDNWLRCIVLINLIIYVTIIILIPEFLLDDYYLFYLISQNPNVPFSTNPGEAFFLFTRPFSYFVFWFDYYVLSANPILIKLFSLFLHNVLVVIIYFLLKKITFVITNKSDDLLIFITTLVFSFHLDSAVWIYWISNQTELLALLFYVLSISTFIKFIDNRSKKYIVASFIFYIASITSKQTGLHLPILFLFIVYLMDLKFDNHDKRRMTFFFVLTILVMILFSTINYYVYKTDLDLSHIVWKKPFSFIGNFLHVILPYYSQGIYNYFLINKVLAIILFGMVVTAFLSLFIFLKKEKSKLLIMSIVFIVIIEYPRIIAVAEHRINSILVFWLIVFLAIVMNRLSGKKNIIIMLIVLFISIFTLLVRVGELTNKINSYDKVITNYIDKVNHTAKDDIVIIAENDFTLNYQAYYKLHNKFGSMTGVINTPLFYDVSLVYFDSEQLHIPFITVFRNGNCLRVESLNDLIFLSIDRKRLEDYFRFEALIPQYKSREYKQVILRFDDDFSFEKYNMIYFNGIEWVTIE